MIPPPTIMKSYTSVTLLDFKLSKLFASSSRLQVMSRDEIVETRLYSPDGLRREHSPRGCCLRSTIRTKTFVARQAETSERTDGWRGAEVIRSSLGPVERRV